MEKGPFSSKIKETDQPTHSEISRTYPSLPQRIPIPSIGGVHIINGMAHCTDGLRMIKSCLFIKGNNKNNFAPTHVKILRYNVNQQVT